MKNKENEKIMKQNTCRTIVNIPNKQLIIEIKINFTILSPHFFI